MSKFNVGDKVQVVSLGSKSSGYGVDIGMIGEIVVEYQHDCECVGVKFDHNIDGHALFHNGKETLEDGATNGLWIEPKNLKFVEEKEQQMEPQFKNMKIRIKDEEHSRLVQETLFEMGYKVACVTTRDSQKPQELQQKFLTCTSTGHIYHCNNNLQYFNDLAYEEVELITTHLFKPVDMEALRKNAEKEALQKNVAEMQKQLDEMKQKLKKIT